MRFHAFLDGTIHRLGRYAAALAAALLLHLPAAQALEYDGEITLPAGKDLTISIPGAIVRKLECSPDRAFVKRIGKNPVIRLRSKGDMLLTITADLNGETRITRMLVHGISRDEWLRRGGVRTAVPSMLPAPDPDPEFSVPPSPVVEEILALTNKERIRHGLQPLKLMPDLCEAASIRAGEIITLTSHTRPDGSPCFTVLKHRGRKCAENIAAGQKTARDAVRAWMESEGHRKNILSPDVTQLGAAYESKPGTKYRRYWVQLFRG